MSMLTQITMLLFKYSLEEKKICTLFYLFCFILGPPGDLTNVGTFAEPLLKTSPLTQSYFSLCWALSSVTVTSNRKGAVTWSSYVKEELPASYLIATPLFLATCLILNLSFTLVWTALFDTYTGHLVQVLIIDII